MNNCFLANPIRVNVLDVKLQIANAIIFVGAVPAAVRRAIEMLPRQTTKSALQISGFYGRNYKRLLAIDPSKTGSNDSDNDFTIDDADLDLNSAELVVSAVETSEVRPVLPAVKYVFDIQAFPEDTLFELQNKIQVVTGIPLFRQHMFWRVQGTAHTTYKLSSGSTDISTLLDQPDETDQILGFAVNRDLYAARNTIRTEDISQFEVLANVPTRTYNIVDCNDQLHSKRAMLSAINTDVYVFEMFYYGVIIRFWPIMTDVVFHDYITSEASLYEKYPRLAPSTTALRRRFAAEAKIISTNYAALGRPAALAIADNNIQFAIVGAVITTKTQTTAELNLRNLFDKLSVGRCVPQIQAVMSPNNRDIFMVKKHHARNQSPIAFPIMYKTGLTIAVSLYKADQDSFHRRQVKGTPEAMQTRYMFINLQADGTYSVKVVFSEEDGYTFARVLALVTKFANPIIRQVNALGRYVFVRGDSLALVTKHDIHYKQLTACVFWRRLLSDVSFRKLKAAFDPYMTAGIIKKRPVQQANALEFMFTKGMIDFDKSTIERVLSMANLESAQNQYTHLSNTTVGQKWDQLYSGRIVVMTHRTADVKFEVVNIKEREFQTFFKYVIAFVLAESSKVNAAPETSFSTNVRKLKRLREMDPELYNLKKHGSDRVYSIICQNPRQPVIHTADELAVMSAAAKQKLVRFHNFTTGQPAFYSCPDKKYPHLSFITKVHPKNYCLPCCGKRPTDTSAKKNEIVETCLRKFKYVNSRVVSDVVGTNTRHVMTYSRNIPVGRIAMVPTGPLNDLLFGNASHSTNGFFIAGVAQNTLNHSGVGVIFCLAELLDCTTAEVAQRFVTGMRSAPKLFTTILGGSLAQAFDDLEDFCSALQRLFIDSAAVDFITRIKFSKYNELFIELAAEFANLHIWLFVDSDGSAQSFQLQAGASMQAAVSTMMNTAGETTSEHALVVQVANFYFPIFELNKVKYFDHGEIAAHTFNASHPLAKVVNSVIMSSIADLHKDTETNRQLDLALIARMSANTKVPITLVKKYINLRNMCYAVDIDHAGQLVYLPLDESAHTADGVPISYKLLDHKPRLNALLALLPVINAYTRLHKVYALLAIDSFVVDDKQVTAAEVNGVYVDAFGKLTDLPKDAKTKPIEFDRAAVNSAILHNDPAADDERKRRRHQGLYSLYVYQLFVFEFVNFVSAERATKLRKTIKAAVLKLGKGAALSALYAVGDSLSHEDSTIFRSLVDNAFVAVFDHAKFEAAMDAAVFDFDMTTIKRLRALALSDRTEAIASIADNFAVESAGEIEGEFPNIYIPCSAAAKNTTDYCDRQQLRLFNTTITEMSSLLAADLSNELKVKYMFSGLFTSNAVEFFDFERRDHIIVTVVRL